MNNQDNAAAKAKAAAAAAAAVAVATPAQRERAIQQAVLSMQREREQQGPPKASDSAPASEVMKSNNSSGPAGYEPPDWEGAPEGVPYALEVLKSGVSVETRNLQSYSHVTFGRSPTADFILEHPSASRLHAVIQFKADDKAAFLYDAGSTHGTFLNKQRVKSHVHIPLRVGDTIKFGQSSRIYLFQGPEELMPEEGLSRAERKQLAMLEIAQKLKERDEQVARVQMEAAINSGGVSWGMGPDAEVPEGEGGVVDWRRYMEKNALTDKQMKIVDKIRKREYKIKNMRTECDRISAKEGSEGGLTSGQAAALVRNEKAIDVLHEEMEELEEQLQDSIADSIAGRKAKAKGDKPAAAKRKRRADSDDEYADASDSGDEFYDRTGAAGPRKKGPGGPGAAKKRAAGGARAKGAEPAEVESSESLYGKRAALQEELKQLESAIEVETQRLQQLEQQRRQQQQLDELEQQMTAAVDGGGAAAAADGEEREGEAEPEAGGLDTLDAFMTDVSTQMEADKLGMLRREHDALQHQLSRTEKLLRIADPEGWYQPGSAAAADLAKAKARKALEAERRKRQAAAAAVAEKKRKAQEGVSLEPEEEEEEDQQQQQLRAGAGGSSSSQEALPGGGAQSSNIHQLPGTISGEGAEVGGLIQRSKPEVGPAAGSVGASGPSSGQPEQQQQQSEKEDCNRKRAEEQAKALMQEFAGVHKPKDAAAATEKKRLVKGPTMPPPKFSESALNDPSAATSAAGASSTREVQSQAAARVAASLALLTGRTPGNGGSRSSSSSGTGSGRGLKGSSKAAGSDAGADGGGAADGGEDVVWVPPQGQTGDGRTLLNEKYGY